MEKKLSILNLKKHNALGKLMFLMLFLILFSTAIMAAPPSSTVSVAVFPEGYNIVVPNVHYIEKDSGYMFGFLVENKSDGVPISSGISCRLILFNSTSGQLLFSGLADTCCDATLYNFNVPASNFSHLGYYHFFVTCNSTFQGGAATAEFIVVEKQIGTLKNAVFSKLSLMYRMFIIMFTIIALYVFLYLLHLSLEAFNRNREMD